MLVTIANKILGDILNIGLIVRSPKGSPILDNFGLTIIIKDGKVTTPLITPPPKQRWVFVQFYKD